MAPSSRPDAFGPDGLGAYVEWNELGVQTVVVKRVVGGTPGVPKTGAPPTIPLETGVQLSPVGNPRQTTRRGQ